MEYRNRIREIILNYSIKYVKLIKSQKDTQSIASNIRSNVDKNVRLLPTDTKIHKCIEISNGFRKRPCLRCPVQGRRRGWDGLRLWARMTWKLSKTCLRRVLLVSTWWMRSVLSRGVSMFNNINYIECNGSGVELQTLEKENLAVGSNPVLRC